MPTQFLFRDDAYLTVADCQIIGHTPEGGLVVDRSVFYATGGGQPGDSGVLEWGGGQTPDAGCEASTARIRARPPPPGKAAWSGTRMGGEYTRAPPSAKPRDIPDVSRR